MRLRILCFLICSLVSPFSPEVVILLHFLSVGDDHAWNIFKMYVGSASPSFFTIFLLEIFWNEELYNEVPPFFFCNIFCRKYSVTRNCIRILYEVPPSFFTTFFVENILERGISISVLIIVNIRSAPLCFYNIFCRKYFGMSNCIWIMYEVPPSFFPTFFVGHILKWGITISA